MSRRKKIWWQTGTLHNHWS